MINLFDATQTTTNEYKQGILKLVERFEKEVLAADDYNAYTTPMGGSTSVHENKLTWVNSGGVKKLAIISEFNHYHALSFLTGTNQQFTFKRFVSPEMQPLAIKQVGGLNKVLDGKNLEILNLPK